ncbi:MAG: hypothetical protein FGM58_10650 [Acidimicrobiia bacterium]|nr:hypothetical protein [Acidimicrobiia bacterium]
MSRRWGRRSRSRRPRSRRPRPRVRAGRRSRVVRCATPAPTTGPPATRSPPAAAGATQRRSRGPNRSGRRTRRRSPRS